VVCKRQTPCRLRALAASPPFYWKGYSRKEDEKLATVLFFGTVVRGKTGRVKKVFLEKDSAQERSAREALNRLILHPDDCPEIKYMLCAALMSSGESARRIVFESRKKGKQSDLAADFQVALPILEKGDGVKVEYAVQVAMTKFGLSRKAVFECVKRVRRKLRSLGVDAF